MMRVLLICLLFLLAVHTCVGKQSEKIIGITMLYRSPSCDDFCRIQVTANKNKKVILETPGIDMKKVKDRRLKRKTVELSSADWIGLLRAFSLDKIKLLPETSGCPGCDGENAVGNLIVVTDKATYRKTFEAQDPPNPLKSLIHQMAKELMKIVDIIR